MIVKYLHKIVDINSIQLLNASEQDYYREWSILPEKFPLTYNKNYIVYAIEYSKEGHEFFYILDDTGVIYPKCYPSSFFLIMDGRLSEFWNNGVEYSDLKVTNFPNLITFQEWQSQEYFEVDMINNEGDANNIFSRYKNLMDLEFRNDSFPTAEVIDDNLFLCSNCGFIFENSDKFEAVECPKCLTIQNKP